MCCRLDRATLMGPQSSRKDVLARDLNEDLDR
jgi:hypothetical protein